MARCFSMGIVMVGFVIAGEFCLKKMLFMINHIIFFHFFNIDD